jgi:hypothetical protein
MNNSNVIRSLFVAILVCTIGSSARAGLMEAMLTAFDALEKASGPPQFVAPVDGNDVPGRIPWGANPNPGEFSSGPGIMYDPVSGNVTAFVPAAVLKLDYGADEYWKGYTLADVSIATQLLGNGMPSYSSEIFEWQYSSRALEEKMPLAEVSITGNLVNWKPLDSATDSTSQFPQYKAVAAVIHFERPLPPGLSLAELRQLAESSQESNFVDYFNHRGIVTQHVPFSLGIVPEPRNAIQVILAIIIVWCSRLRRLSIVPSGC